MGKFTLSLNMQRISFLYTVFAIKTIQMEFYDNKEVDHEYYDSYASDGTSESDFDFVRMN